MRAYERLQASLHGKDALIERLERIRKLPPPEFTEPQWRVVRRGDCRARACGGRIAIGVSRAGLRGLRRAFHSRFRCAWGGWTRPKILALALGNRIQHLLVDEFQDTSHTQFELIEKLTAGWEPGDGRTLFLVGDPMQSIYRFRQADVSLFLKARLEGVGAIQLEPLTLSVNFRSRPGIVDWVNRTFESVLPAEDDVESGAVAYSPGVPGSSGDSDAPIGVHAFVDARDEADRVMELIGRHADDSIAILVRSRTPPGGNRSRL